MSPIAPRALPIDSDSPVFLFFSFLHYASQHVLLDCLSSDLAVLRIKHHHLVCNLYSGLSKLRDIK